jgi:DNA-binding beta-propeller fold protein YncE
MPPIVANSDASFVESQDQDSFESEPSLIESEQQDVAESDTDPVEAEGEDTAESDASLSDGAGVAEGDPDLVNAVEEGVAEGGADLGETVQGIAASDADLDEQGEEEKKRRRWLLLWLVLLLLLLCCAGAMFYRYLNQPAPLPDLLPVPVDVNYAPHYLFSIYGMDQPVGVALSPQGDRIYVAETGGERLVKIFDRDGNSLGSFSPPRTGPGERSPVYLATDSTGRVFVTDRLQHAVFVYDREGGYLDTILAPDLTLGEYVFKQVAGLKPGATYAYDLFESDVYYQQAGEEEQTLPAPNPFAWSPLGIRIDGQGNILLTDVSTVRNVVREIPTTIVLADSWQDAELPQRMFGETGQGNGQLLFPNSAVSDSQGRIYVTDGNNGRLSVWDARREFLFTFAQGAGDGALSLPRGAAMDGRDRLHVVDAVGQDVKVYDVSGPEPDFLFAFGDWGLGDGQFDFPNDIILDDTGRLYIADRENNRIQVWSY